MSSLQKQNRGPLFRKRLSCFLKKGEAGNVLLYVFLAVGLLAALTYAFAKDSRENFSSQMAVRTAEELFVQVNLIRSSVHQCEIEFPNGGGDLNADGVIDTNDNPNNPYPINPSSPLNPAAPAGIAAAANNMVKNLTCVGAPAAEANMFQGANNQGRFLPPPPSSFTDWVYANDSRGVYIQITASNDASAINALNRLMSKFGTCQADLNYNGCGARCFTAWIVRAACP